MFARFLLEDGMGCSISSWITEDLLRGTGKHFQTKYQNKTSIPHSLMKENITVV